MSIENPEIRIVGGAPPEKKEAAKKELQEALFNHFESLSPEEQKKMKKFEYKKSDKEKSLIDFANQETNKLRREAGMEPYKIPYENYHLLPSKKYQELGGEGSDAMVYYMRQGILCNAEKLRQNLLWLGKTLLHETLHLKGHFAIEVGEGPDKKVEKTVFRGGVSAYGVQRGKPHKHFAGLHEAIVAAQNKKSFPALLDLPFFQKEREWLMSDEAKKIRRGMAEKRKIPEDEFIWVDKKRWAVFSYFFQRQVLDYVCAEIQKEHPQKYQTKDDVFKEFLKSHFTGQLLPIARLVEKTFGEGSFRILGNMSEEESAVLHMESFRKMRDRQQKKKNFNR